MRTTLNLDDDAIDAARAIADHDRRTIGEVVSELIRLGLRRHAPELTMRNGIPMLPRRGVIITPDFVNELRDDEE